MTTETQPFTARQSHHGRVRTLREYVCDQCAETFIGRADKARRFCSLACANTANGRHGAANNRYNGGLSRSIDGRWLICCRDGSLMFYSRGVVAAEIGRLLRPDEIVHHRNGKSDDDRVENLQVVTRAEHIEIHRADLLRGKHGN